MSIARKKAKRLRALRKYTDGSLQHLINEAYQILGNPIILYDMDWKTLAYAEGVVTDDPFWNNHVDHGSIDGNMSAYIDEGFIDIMTRADRVVLLSSENIKYDRFFGKLYGNDELPVAALSVVAANRLFEDDDLMVTEVICKILSGEIRKMPFYQRYAQIKLGTYMNMLIDGSIKDSLYATGYIEVIYKGLKDNLYVAVVDISHCDPTYSKLNYFFDLFIRERPSFKYSIYSNYIVFIMSTDSEHFEPKRYLGRLNTVIKKDHLRVGISSRFENLFELQRYYFEAVSALNDGPKNR